MTNTSPTDQEMTDVFSRFSAPLPPVSQPADDRIKISDRKKAALATAAVLLGGGATFAAVSSDLFDNPSENDSDGERESSKIGSSETITSEVEATYVLHNTPSAVQNGTITPSENIDIAQRVEPGMAFGEAYATAREEVGSGGIFSWRGEVYNTYTVEEWQGLSLGQRREFLGDVGYRPMESVVASEEVSGVQFAGNGNEAGSGVIGSDPGISDETGTVGVNGITDGENPDDALDIEPAYFDLVINGRPALGIDDNHDGIADAIVFIDEATNGIIAFVDAEDDEMIDTIIQFDATTQQIVGQQAIEDPFMVEISQLEAMNELAANSVDMSLAYVANTEVNFNDDFDNDEDFNDDSGYVNDADMPDMD